MLESAFPQHCNRCHAERRVPTTVKTKWKNESIGCPLFLRLLSFPSSPQPNTKPPTCYTITSAMTNLPHIPHLPHFPHVLHFPGALGGGPRRAPIHQGPLNESSRSLLIRDALKGIPSLIIMSRCSLVGPADLRSSRQLECVVLHLPEPDNHNRAYGNAHDLGYRYRGTAQDFTRLEALLLPQDRQVGK